MSHFLLRAQHLSAQKRGNGLFSDLWLQVAAGKVTGVIGLDTEGKSALTAILSGRQKPDGGRLYFNGKLLCPEQAADCLKRAVRYMGPEEILADQLSLADNLFVLGRKPAGKGLRRWFADDLENRRRARDYLALAGLPHAPETLAGSLNADEKQRAEFLRALLQEPSIIVCNTPLKRSELVADEDAFRILLDYARACGIGVVMMFNNVDRLMRLCDYAVVVRNGHTVCLCEKREFEKARLLKMLGWNITVIPQRAAAPLEQAVLEFQNASTKDGSLDGFSLRIHKGESVGIICPDDEWIEWFVEMAQGKYPLCAGRILRCGRPASPASLRQVYSGDHCTFIITGSENMGLLQHMSASDNLLLPLQNRIRTPWFWIGDDIQTYFLRLCMENQILSGPAESDLPVENLSAEKKLRIWMVRAQLYHPDLCIFLGLQEENNPVLKKLLLSFIRQLTGSGAAVLMLSTQKSPMSEAACRLLFVKNGRMQCEIQS